MASIRLTAILTHPVQYYSPWFRHIAAQCPEIDLTVLYGTEPTPVQQGVGFGQSFSWDEPLTEGYRCHIVRSAKKIDNVHSGQFWGLNVPEMKAAIQASHPDIALVSGWHSITLLRAMRTCRSLGVPVLYRGDTHLGNAPVGWRRSIWTWKTRFLLRQFAACLSVGQRSRGYLRYFGVPETNVFDAPHCVDNAFFAASAAPYRTEIAREALRASFGFAPGQFVALFVGKLEPKKRLFDLIEAVARFGPNTGLLVVGSGVLEQASRDAARRLGVKAFWAGFLNQSEISRSYAAADCLVLPSDWGETWGLVVNEAMAAGLPCVVSDRVGCAPDLITAGETGEVFPMGDIDALGTALQHIRQKLDTGYVFAPACQKRAAQYSYQQATEGLLKACKALVSQDFKPDERRPKVLACCGGMVVVFGLERMTFEALRVLRDRGVPVHCIVNEWENHRIVAEAERIGATWSTGYYQYRLDRHVRNPIKIAQTALALARTNFGLLNDALRFRPTHILVPEFSSVLRNWPALAWLRLLGMKVFLYVHNAPFPSRFYGRLWRFGIGPVVSKVVCVSDHILRELTTFGLPTEKLTTVQNTVPRRPGAERQNALGDGNKIIFVGQIIPEKGLDLLLEAMAILIRRSRRPSLDIIGEMNGWVADRYRGYRERLKSRAADADLAGKVRFLGRREDVPALLTSAGIHCIPSRPEMLEGQPLAVLEAKNARIPSVAFAIGPFPELIAHRKDGWLCREISASALADGLEYFLSDPERTRRAGEAAQISARRFGPERFSEEWCQLFQPAQ